MTIVICFSVEAIHYITVKFDLIRFCSTSSKNVIAMKSIKLRECFMLQFCYIKDYFTCINTITKTTVCF